MTPASAPDLSGPSVGATALPWAVGVVGGLVLIVWAGAVAAALFTGGDAAIAFGDAAAASVRLPSHLSDPAAAWPIAVASELPGPLAYWSAQLVVVLGLVVGAVAAVRLWRRYNGPPRPFGIDPEVTVAARSHLRPLAVSKPVAGRVTIGRSGRQLLATEPDTSLAVVGPSGCGKTVGFAIPALLEWSGPILACSVKADLIDATIAHRRRRGRVWVYDPSGSSGQPTASWSPLDACRTWAGAMRVAAWMTETAQARSDSVADADYWYAAARKGLAPYLHAAAVTGAGISTLVRWVDVEEEKDVEEALMLASIVDPLTGEIRRPPSAQQRLDLIPASLDVAADLPTDADVLAPLAAARALWGKEARLRSSVYATMEVVLAGWADPGVAAAGSGSDTLDLDEWLRGDNTLYVVATAHEQARLRPVLTTLVQQAVRRAYDTAATNGGRLDRPCLLLLDEAAHTTPLRDLPGYAATARSHGISLVTVWQDVSQIRAIYGDRARTVLNNHRARLFGSGIADIETLDFVSRLVGDQARTERNFSADLTGAGRRSISEHRTWRRAAPTDVLRRIRPGESVLLYGSVPPAHVRLRPWFADRSLRRLATGDGPATRRWGRR